MYYFPPEALKKIGISISLLLFWEKHAFFYFGNMNEPYCFNRVMFSYQNRYQNQFRTFEDSYTSNKKKQFLQNPLKRKIFQAFKYCQENHQKNIMNGITDKEVGIFLPELEFHENALVQQKDKQQYVPIALHT